MHRTAAACCVDGTAALGVSYLTLQYVKKSDTEDLLIAVLPDPRIKGVSNSVRLGIQPHGVLRSINLNMSRSMVVFHHKVTLQKLDIAPKNYQSSAAVCPVAAQTQVSAQRRGRNDHQGLGRVLEGAAFGGSTKLCSVKDFVVLSLPQFPICNPVGW